MNAEPKQTEAARPEHKPAVLPEDMSGRSDIGQLQPERGQRTDAASAPVKVFSHGGEW